MSKAKLTRFIFCAVILVLGFISQANATPMTVGFLSSTAHLLFIPPNSSGSDQFSMQGESGSINLDSVLPTVNFVNYASLTEGHNCPLNSCAYSGGFTSSFGLTLFGSQNGYGEFVAQPATFTSALSGDTVVAGFGPPVLFVLNGMGSWEVTLNPFDINVQGYGARGNAAVFATFTPVPDSFPSATPEPTSAMLFGTGLLGIVLLLRKSLLA